VGTAINNERKEKKMKELKCAAEVTPDELETIKKLLGHLYSETKLAETIVCDTIDEQPGEEESKDGVKSIIKSTFEVFYRVLGTVVLLDHSQGRIEIN
jgi:hypothetical protein